MSLAHRVTRRFPCALKMVEDVDRTRVDLVRLQDDVAQVGQGVVADRSRERLGRADAGIIAIRRVWTRELRALAEGRPLKQWRVPDDVAATSGV